MKKAIAMFLLGGAALAAVPASADVINVADTAYIDTSDTSVWQESNGEAGLQRDGDNPDSRVL